MWCMVQSGVADFSLGKCSKALHSIEVFTLANMHLNYWHCRGFEVHASQWSGRRLLKRLWTFKVQNWKHLCSLIKSLKSRHVTRSDNSGLRNYGYFAIDLLIISVIVIEACWCAPCNTKEKWPATFAKSLQSRHFQLYHRFLFALMVVMRIIVITLMGYMEKRIKLLRGHFVVTSSVT